MTASALTRPGERDRLIVKIGQIDWTFVFLVCLIAGIGGMMLYSIANASWTLSNMSVTSTQELSTALSAMARASIAGSMF